MPDEALVLVSCANKQADTIAHALVQERLAACVSILSKVVSVYHWQGQIQKEEESLLLIKTNKSQWQSLKKRVQELHSYEVPEIILVPIELGHAPYLDWLNQELGTKVVAGNTANPG